jgi:hypothetical protein
MKRSILLGAALAACAFYAAAAGQTKAAPPAEIDEIAGELSRISGLKQLHKIDSARISREQVKAYIAARVKEEVKPAELRAEELALKKFGFVPQDFDLKQTTIDLLSEQAAAFYDYRKKKLFIIDSTPDAMQEPALAHELAHALADQHFHLDKFIGKARDDDDSSLARMAVMEGQATWLMSEYMARKTGHSIEDSPMMLDMMAKATEAASTQYPVFAKAPLYLREMMLFPYSQGLLFQQAVVKKMGKAGFAEVFRRPPETTAQVLHPERYFAGERPRRPELGPLARGWKLVDEAEFGELDASILLRQYAGPDEAAKIAPEWNGGSYRLAEEAGRVALEWATEWRSPEAARAYFEAYRKALAGKWKNLRVDSESGAELAGRGDDGYFLLRVAGSRVSGVEGLAEAAAASAARR